ncbi:unnamed protein product [Caenorhabditis brenneri]
MASSSSTEPTLEPDALDQDKKLDGPRLFTQLNMDELSGILEYLNIVDRMLLRRVSMGQQAVYEQRPISCKKLYFRCTYSMAQLMLDDTVNVYYFDKKEGCEVLHATKVIKDRTRKLLDGYNFATMALNDVKMILKNPKLKLEKITIQIHLSLVEKENEKCQKPIDSLKRFLESLEHKIHAEELTLEGTSLNDVNLVLPYFQPTVLKTIMIDNHYHHTASKEVELEAIKNLCTLQQWREAVNCGFQLNLVNDEAFENCFSHFISVTAYNLALYSFNLDSMLEIMDQLTACELFKVTFFQKVEPTHFSPNFEMVWRNWDGFHASFPLFSEKTGTSYEVHLEYDERKRETHVNCIKKS